MKFKPGTILSIFSLSISLFVLGLYFLILVHVSGLIEIVNEHTPFVIELKDSITTNQINTLKSELKTNNAIFDIVFISKEEGLKLMEKQLGENILEEDEKNPLTDLIKLKLKNEFIQDGKEVLLKKELLKNEIVKNCIFEKESVESLRKNLINLNSIFLFLGIIFILISFILIYNNLKFILHADRFTIKTMELVGGSPSFIKRPYIKLAVKIGFFSGIIAAFLLSALLIYFDFRYDIFETIVDINRTIPVLIGVFIISLLLPPIFINHLVKKYLIISDSSRYS